MKKIKPWAFGAVMLAGCAFLYFGDLNESTWKLATGWSLFGLGGVGFLSMIAYSSGKNGVR
jgi:1,4-dihydroxy-2-naphthoate octaprenyltransferase